MIGPENGLVLVTGASGFVGGALVPALAADGWRVRAAAREPDRVTLGLGVEAVASPDLSRPADWSHLLEGVTHVVHLAGVAHTGGIADAVYARVNTGAAAELARAAKEAGVARFVLMSSVRAQSGASANGVLTEETPPAPTDAYGRSKLAAERAVAGELGEAAVNLRPVLVIGPGAKGNLAALRRLAASRLPLPFGALHNRRSLLGSRNLVSIVKFVLTAELAGKNLFLAADSEALSIADLIAAMRGALGRKPGLVSVTPRLLGRTLALAGKRALAASLLGDLVVSTARLTGAGWRPVSSTADEIARMVKSRP